MWTLMVLSTASTMWIQVTAGKITVQIEVKFRSPCGGGSDAYYVYSDGDVDGINHAVWENSDGWRSPDINSRGYACFVYPIGSVYYDYGDGVQWDSCGNYYHSNRNLFFFSLSEYRNICIFCEHRREYIRR